MDGETSPFIEIQNNKMGGSIKLSDSIDMSYIINIVLVIVLIYVVYISYNKFIACDDEEDEDSKSYVEEQIQQLNERQERNIG